jgi:hypothetical protein
VRARVTISVAGPPGSVMTLARVVAGPPRRR